jgi:uncharacterized protein YbdZ (MbtH family)
MEPLELEFTVVCDPARAFSLWAEQSATPFLWRWLTISPIRDSIRRAAMWPTIVRASKRSIPALRRGCPTRPPRRHRQAPILWTTLPAVSRFSDNEPPRPSTTSTSGPASRPKLVRFAASVELLAALVDPRLNRLGS